MDLDLKLKASRSFWIPITIPAVLKLVDGMRAAYAAKRGVSLRRHLLPTLKQANIG